MKLRDLFTLNRTHIHSAPRPAFPTSGYGGALDQRGAGQTSAEQYMAWVESVLAWAVVQEQLDCVCDGGIEGPMTLTYPVRLTRPAKTVINALMAMGPTFTEALRSHANAPMMNGEVRVTRHPRKGILIEVPHAKPYTPRADRLMQYAQGLSVCVGITGTQEPLVVDLRDYPTIMFVGATGQGKTEAARSMLAALASANGPCDFLFLILAQKHRRWADFEGAIQCEGVVSEPDDIKRALKAVDRLMDERLRTGESTPALLVIYDDLHNLLRVAPELGKRIEGIGSTGREAHIFQWLITQYAGSKETSGGVLVEGNAKGRLCYRAPNRYAASRMSGVEDSGLEKLSENPGDAAWFTDGPGVRVATAYGADGRRLAQGEAIPAWRTPKTVTNNGYADPPPQEAQNQAQEGGDNHVTERLAVSWPVLPARPLLPHEAAEVQRMAGKGVSQTAICKVVYENKNDVLWQYIQDALVIGS